MGTALAVVSAGVAVASWRPSLQERSLAPTPLGSLLGRSVVLDDDSEKGGTHLDEQGDETTDVEQEVEKVKVKGKSEDADHHSEAVCKMAVKDDDCYKSVVWAMTTGIKDHPEWYDKLTKKSPFEDFQAHLAMTPDKTKCIHKPCKTAADCKTAKPDSPCYAGVKWDMTDGISKHPEWYPDLSSTSTFEEFQNHAHHNNKTLCPTEACNPQPFQLQTLFCWMAVQVDGYELGLATAQLEKKAGIFACDDYLLVSTKDLGIDGVTTLTISNMQVGGYTDGGTSPNAPIFVEAWNQIQSDGRWKEHDWTIKSDPDAVLIPERLRMTLLPGNQPENPYPPPYESDPSLGQFVTNCDKMAGWGKGWGDGWPMMYGSLEIISRNALATYYAKRDTCQGPDGNGEDAYMGLCLRSLKIGELFMRQGDNVCAGGACSDKSFSTYHPYKDPNSWFDCWGQATR